MAYKSSNTKLITKPSIKRPSVSMKPSIDDNQLQVGFTPSLQNFNKPQANSEQILLNRDVFNKEAFNNTINTNFSQLDQEPIDLSFFDPNLATVEDFFNIYQNLFFQIPKFGDINSHQYLVVESTEYTNFIENQEQIEALLEEITELRQDNLQLQLDISELLGVKTTLDQAIRQTGEASSLEELLQAEADLGAEQSTSNSDNLTPSTPIPGVNTFPSSSPAGFGGGGGGGGGGIPGVTSGFTDAFSSQENSQFGAPLPSFGFGGSNTNPGNLVY